MRFYILFEPDSSIAKSISQALDAHGEFRCLQVVKDANFKIHKILEFPPELVIINLDKFPSASIKLVEKLNLALGIPPKYIGVTNDITKGFEAFKNGFVDIINLPLKGPDLQRVVSRYKTCVPSNRFICLRYYHDFHYLKLNNIVYLKADNYTTEFFTTDGKQVTNFKTLKHSHEQLPTQFQRIHKSYVINSHFVRRIHIGKHELYLQNVAKPLPISKSFLPNICIIKSMLMNATTLD